MRMMLVVLLVLVLLVLLVLVVLVLVVVTVGIIMLTSFLICHDYSMITIVGACLIYSRFTIL